MTLASVRNFCVANFCVAETALVESVAKQAKVVRNLKESKADQQKVKLLRFESSKSGDYCLFWRLSLL